MLGKSKLCELFQECFRHACFLERFFDNLLFGAGHQPRNRDMQISMGQSDTEESPKCQNGPLNVTLEERALLEFVKNNPKATQEQIAEYIGKSSRTVKRITASLYEKGCLKRENGKRKFHLDIAEKAVQNQIPVK